MIEHYVRPGLDKFIVNPLARIVIKLKVMTPNNITVLAGLTGLMVFPALVYWQNKLLAIGLIIFSGILDTLDGAVARQTNASTCLGTVLDIVSDRLVEATIIISLFYCAPQVRGASCLFMLASILLCVTSFLVVGIFAQNNTAKSFYYSPGLMERPEAFGFFITMIIWPQYFNILASIFVGLVLLTTMIRCVEFARQSQADNTAVVN